MTILLSGGGTGGHVTPILSIAHDIKRLDSSAKLVYVGERKGGFRSLLEDSEIDQALQIFAGKYRRYHGESWLERLTDIKTIALNFRDAFYFLLGFVQALRVVRRVRPDAVFLKGGFVGVPVGLAAALYNVPIMTHDSDATAGLANRLISRWTTVHATALPPERYPYPKEKVLQTGVIVSDAYEKVSSVKQRAYKKAIGIPEEATVLLVTGGSTGANAINQSVIATAPELLQNYNNLYIIHQTGKGKAGEYGPFSHERLVTREFLPELHTYSGAADLIVMRAGANTLAEFGVQAKPCIVIPSPHLTGGHQLENAKWLAEKEAIYYVDQHDMEADSATLYEAIVRLLDSVSERRKLAHNIHAIADNKASSTIAKKLISLNQRD